MKLELFEMERTQSIWENQVRYNLSESGVHPMRLGELIGSEDIRDVLLGYPQSNGTPQLRERIADLYPGADSDNVLVTVGTAEANFVSVLHLVEPEDEVVVMHPNYMQIWGLARSLGAQAVKMPLREENGWAPDFDELRRSVTSKTRLIAVCNPNNPTGAVLAEESMRTLCQIAGGVGAWLLADEVYQGAELSGETTPSFWGWYDRLLVTCGLSKAYGLPGLRLGWIVGPADKVKELWSYKDYTTIGTTALGQHLAAMALQPGKRQKVLERTRDILRRQLPVVEKWVAGRGGRFHYLAPRAGGIAYLRYDLDIPSVALTERLRDEKSVLLVPGEHFGMGRYLRIGYGAEPEVLEKGLGLFTELLETVGVDEGARR